MVGLIPNSYILHLTGKTRENSITNNRELTELASREHIKFVSTQETKHLKSIIREFRPEILLIEEEVFVKNYNDNQVSYRSKSCQPFKLVYVKEGHSKEEVFEFFRNGADDVISHDVSNEEILLKVLSILRRKTILEQNQLTGLPSINRTYTVLEHCRNHLSDWAVIHLDILNFQSYSTMYGIGKADTAIQLTAKTLSESFLRLKPQEYFLGHLGRDNFLIISDTNHFEEIIFHIRKDFKKVLDKIYKPADLENGYIISSAPSKVRRKEGLLDLNIGYCTNIDRNYLSGTDIIEQAVKNKKLAELKNKRVMIVENDSDFASLLEETLVREGNEARLSSDIEKIIDDIERFQPRTLILEAAKVGAKNFTPLCSQLARFKEEFGLKILVATNVPGYQNFLANGADVYIPKPYDLEILLKEVRRLRYTHI